MTPQVYGQIVRLAAMARSRAETFTFEVKELTHLEGKQSITRFRVESQRVGGAQEMFETHDRREDAERECAAWNHLTAPLLRHIDNEFMSQLAEITRKDEE